MLRRITRPSSAGEARTRTPTPTPPRTAILTRARSVWPKAAYSVRETLDVLSIGRTALYVAVKRGELSPIKFRRKTLFLAVDSRHFSRGSVSPMAHDRQSTDFGFFLRKQSWRDRRGRSEKCH